MMEQADMQKLEELVDGLELRSGLYLYEPGYKSAVNFVSGYECACAEYGHFFILEDFNTFMAAKAGVGNEVIWWSSIEFMADGDEEKALEILFSSLKEFLNQKKKGNG